MGIAVCPDIIPGGKEGKWYPCREAADVVVGRLGGEDVNHRLGQQDRDSPGKPSRCGLVNSRPVGWKSYA